MKIALEKSKCIGCGTCAALCAEVFEIGDDGKAHLKGSQPAEELEELELKNVSCVKDAIDACPVQCIKLSP